MVKGEKLFQGGCPVCGLDWAVTREGVMRKHRASLLIYADGEGSCRGSGQPFKVKNA